MGYLSFAADKFNPWGLEYGLELLGSSRSSSNGGGTSGSESSTVEGQGNQSKTLQVLAFGDMPLGVKFSDPVKFNKKEIELPYGYIIMIAT